VAADVTLTLKAHASACRSTIDGTFKRPAVCQCDLYGCCHIFHFQSSMVLILSIGIDCRLLRVNSLGVSDDPQTKLSASTVKIVPSLSVMLRLPCVAVPEAFLAGRRL
jgi:hypothetical protein